MRSSIRERKTGATVRLGFVKPEYQQDYHIPLLPHQKSGIRNRELWASRDQIIRIIPGYDPTTGEVYRQNVKCNEFALDADYSDYLSDTFYAATVITGFCGGKMLITDYAPDSEEVKKYGGNTVLRCFTSTIFNSLRAERDKKQVRCQGIPEWKQWMGKQGKLPLPKTALLMQALMFKINGEYMHKSDANWEDRDSKDLLVGPNGEPLPLLGVVAMTQKESTKNLFQALVEPRDNNLPLDALTNNKYGGMAEAEGNLLYLNSVTNADGTRTYLRPSVQEAAQGWNPSPFPLSVEQIKALWVPWEKLLNFMSPEEQMLTISNEFGADSVNYVIGLDPRFRDLPIPENIARAGFGRYAAFAGKATLNVANASISVSTTSLPADEIRMEDAPAVPKPSFGGLGSGLAPKASAPKPSMAPGIPSGLAAPATVNPAAIKDELKRMGISGVAAPPQSQVDMANDLLEDSEVEYEGPKGFEDKN